MLPHDTGRGRLLGSRTVFSPGFLKDLAEVWSGEGRETMVKTARTSPATFFAVCARLIGPEVKLTIEQSLPGNLSMEDWAMMREIVEAVKQAIPDASSQPPGAVFSTTRTGCRTKTVVRMTLNAQLARLRRQKCPPLRT